MLSAAMIIESRIGRTSPGSSDTINDRMFPSKKITTSSDPEKTHDMRVKSEEFSDSDCSMIIFSHNSLVDGEFFRDTDPDCNSNIRDDESHFVRVTDLS